MVFPWTESSSPRNSPIYLLDTDIASYFLQGGYPRLDSRRRHESPGSIFVSVLTQAELLFGLKSLSSQHPRRADVDRFLSLAQILDWDGPAAEAYADVRYRLILSSQPIGELDMMIAAHALSLGAVLVTNNTRHYQRLCPPLQIENWTEA